MERLLALVAVLYFASQISAAKYPSNLPKCHYGETQCIANAINTYVHMLKDGLRDINLVRLDPLHVNEVDIIQGNESPVNVNLNFKDVDLYGLSEVNVKKVIGFDKDPLTSKFEIHANCAQLILIARYKVKGKVIVLPVVGNGPSNLTFDNVDFSIKFYPKVEVRKDKQYLAFSDVKFDFHTTRLWIQFTNLFNGNKALSEGTNQFLNENWQDILNELKPVLKKAIGNIVGGVMGPIFSKFPYDQFFLP